MGFGEAIKTCFSKYATFAGRASRSEYWWFYLFCVLLVLVGVMLDLTVGSYNPDDPDSVPWLTFLFALPVILPSLSAMVRRLHDTDRSGWWYWIGLIPLVGSIVLLVFLVQAGTDGDNRYGPKPVS